MLTDESERCSFFQKSMRRSSFRFRLPVSFLPDFVEQTRPFLFEKDTPTTDCNKKLLIGIVVFLGNIQALFDKQWHFGTGKSLPQLIRIFFKGMKQRIVLGNI